MTKTEALEQQIIGLKRLAITTGLLGILAGFLLAIIITMPPVWLGAL